MEPTDERAISGDPHNPWAFPLPGHEGYTANAHGMTLRDYFAAKAIEGAVEKQFSDELLRRLGDREAVADAIASAGYLLANAMLHVRRSQRQGPRERVVSLWQQHAAWSRATFGSDSERGPAGPLMHLEREAREAAADPSDASEYADCLLLVFDAARRSGLSLSGLLDAAHAKLAVNKQRERPKQQSSTLPVEHVPDS